MMRSHRGHARRARYASVRSCESQCSGSDLSLSSPSPSARGKRGSRAPAFSHDPALQQLHADLVQKEWRHLSTQTGLRGSELLAAFKRAKVHVYQELVHTFPGAVQATKQARQQQLASRASLRSLVMPFVYRRMQRALVAWGQGAAGARAGGGSVLPDGGLSAPLSQWISAGGKHPRGAGTSAAGSAHAAGGGHPRGAGTSAAGSAHAAGGGHPRGAGASAAGSAHAAGGALSAVSSHQAGSGDVIARALRWADHPLGRCFEVVASPGSGGIAARRSPTFEDFVLGSDGSLRGVYPGDIVTAYGGVVSNKRAFVEADLEVDGYRVRVFFPIVADGHQVLVPTHPQP